MAIIRLNKTLIPSSVPNQLIQSAQTLTNVDQSILIKFIQGQLITVPQFEGEDVGSDGNSYFNNIVKSSLIFGDINKTDNVYIDLDGREQRYRTLALNTVLFEVTNTKNIVKTSIQGLDGTIKEYISTGDYMITVNGIISNKFNQYPKQSATDLQTILNVPDTVPVTSEFLSLFGINEVVIEDYRIFQERGKQNEQPFSITMLSDKQLNLEDVEIS